MYTRNVDFTLASGPSTLSGVRLHVTVLFADLRGFSDWTLSVCDPEPVGAIVKQQYEAVIQVCNDYHSHFHKFLGDGFLMLWEEAEEIDANLGLHHALDAAFHLHKKYWYFSRELLRQAPRGYGIGIASGQVVRIQMETCLKEMNEVDYLGYPMNCGARMQSLSNAFGVTVCSETVARIQSDPASFLHDGTPSFRRALLPPSPEATAKAQTFHGLRPADRSAFKSLTWELAQKQLWGDDGRL